MGERLRVSSSREIFDDLARDVELGQADQRRRLVLLGYSGWAPEQLESEIRPRRVVWPVPLDSSILFEVTPPIVGEKAYALLGLTPTNVMSMRSIGQA